MHGPREIYTTWPDADSAQAAAGIAVTEGLCACANLLPGMTSVYRWQGAIETAAECVALCVGARGGSALTPAVSDAVICNLGLPLQVAGGICNSRASPLSRG